MKNAKKGFTLVEVVISFAVLAIISGALLQMFVVSTNVNHRAYNTDKANALIVRIQEAFKKNPDAVLDVSETAEIGELVGAIESDGVVTAYFDKDWQTCVVEESAFTMTVKRTSAVYTIESDSYYPNGTDPDPDWVLSSFGESDLIFDGSPVMAQLTGYDVWETLGAEATIILYYGENGDSAKMLNITNNSTQRIHVYVLNVPERDDALYVNTIEGSVSYTAINSHFGTGAFETLDLEVKRNSDNSVLASSSAGRYVPAAPDTEG